MKSKIIHLLLLLLFCLMPTIAFSSVQLALEANPNPVRPGEIVNISLTVVNDDNLASTGDIELILHYPENLDSLFPPSYITTGGAENTVHCSSGSYCSSGALVTWSLGSLPPGGGVTVTMPPHVNSETADGAEILFEAEVRVDGIQQVQVSKTAQVQANPFFELTVDEETDPFTSSGNLEYTLSYGNIGTTSSNTQLTFPLPTGTSLVSATDGGSEVAGEVTWNIGSLINGAGGERKVTVQVNADEADLLKVDTALLSGTDSNTDFHQVKTGRVTRVEDDERLTLAINLNPHPVKPGEQMNVELTVTNPSSSLMANVELILRYPEHFDSLYPPSYITTGGAANTVHCSSGTYCNTAALVTWSLGNLPPGGGVTVTMPPHVNSETVYGTLIQFEAEVRVDGIQQAQVSKTARVQANPFFELTVDEETDPFTSSGNLEYTLSYGNIGTTSSNTQLTFPLPTGTSLVLATDGGSEVAGEVTWNIGSLINGAGGERKVTVQVNADEADLLKVDTALLSGTDSNTDFHQVKTGRVTRVEDDERLTLAINLNPHPVEKGEQLNVELTVTNPTSSLMANVELIMRYPEHLDSLYPPSDITTGGAENTVYCSSGTYCNTAALVTWNLNTLPPGEGVTVTMPPTVHSETVDGTLIQFEAEVRVGGIQQTSISKTAFVGTDFSFSNYPGDKNDIIYFPIKAQNGKIVIICM